MNKEKRKTSVYTDNLYEQSKKKKLKTGETGQESRIRQKVTKEQWIEIAFHIWRQFDDRYYTGFAAQIAYFFFMASVPTLIVLSQMLGFFDLSLNMLKNWVSEHVNPNMVSVVSSLFDASSAKMSNIVMIVLALWAASALEFSLSRLTSYTLSEGMYRFSFWKERLKAIPTAFFSIFAIAFTLVGFVYGEEIFTHILHFKMLSKILMIVRLPILAALFFAMILLNYYILPRIRVPIVAVLPGAIFASISIIIFTVFYAIYVANIANYDILYGAFASIVALMLWFYFIAWMLCIGMMFNKAWDDVLKKNRLTRTKMIEYIEKQMRGKSEDYRKYLIFDDQKYVNDNETISVKMSKKFIKGYAEKRKKEQEKKNRERL